MLQISCWLCSVVGLGVGGWLEEGSTHHAQVLPLGLWAGSKICWNVYDDELNESGRSH